MSQLLKFLLLLQIILTLTGEVCAKERPLASPPLHPTASKKSKDTVHISADHIVQGAKKKTVFAWGNVKIQYQDRTLWADKVWVDNATGVGKAKGDVRLVSGDGTRMKAKQTLFDLKAEQGKVFKAKGKLGKQFFITGKKIHRLSNTHFKVKKGSLTSCEGILPDWEIEADFADVIRGDRALFKNAVLKVRDIPVLYLPVGYIPINQKRKTGFLMPDFGWSDTAYVLFKGAFFWAINKWSDATFYVERELGGIRPTVEYRYTPMQGTAGQITGTFFEDNSTNQDLWKVDATHSQKLPNKFNLKGALDLGSNRSLTRFDDTIEIRSRLHSDSFANIERSWSNSSLDITTRYQDTVGTDRDDTLGQLPNISYKIQSLPILKTPLYFNMDTSAGWFVTDLNLDPGEDELFRTSRFDFHPQLRLSLPLSPWFSITPTVGARETLYGRGLRKEGSTNKKLSSFSRESFDVSIATVGPKIDRIFYLKNSTTKLKHLIEPNLTFNYIPDIDEADRLKIKSFDGIDGVGPQTNISYALNQRVLKKVEVRPSEFETREVMRLSVSQSYDIREATIEKSAGSLRRPFSEIRFDWDSRPVDSLLFNMDATFNHVDNLVNTVNFEAGIKPVNNFWLIMERRWVRNGTNFIRGTVDWSFKPGWRLQYSARFDGLTSTFRENYFSMLYDDPCRCWGFSFDIIDRQFRNTNNIRSDKTRFMWNIHLRGVGDLRSGTKKKLLHRDFEESKFPDTRFRHAPARLGQ